ncbi:hypothetical protein FYJ84_13200 [Veillonellaceae bacterium WCA-693-APC-5D-A]|uniref:Uncharacterized protein n=1 Tax=Anaerovibrio slackiae TaxID=2652309 RepID=A0A6I2UME2_9FIRM|nr:hypothetical protein [Anaerovibrio slackiae]MSU09926.1 hypothetical protein [Anaerovibrio slackiae]
MEVDIVIDVLTECLVERSTGQNVKTEFRSRTEAIRPNDFREWKFNWKLTEENGYTIYELFVTGDDTVQGRISLRIDGGGANVEIVETAPHNYGHNGKYEGVEGRLFAIARKASMDAGCNGVVAFTAKSSFVDYYKQLLHAVEIAPRRMVILEDAANILLSKYMEKE